MADLQNRRPLASRQTGWAAAITRWLAATTITPNQISMAGMGAALLSGACFWLAGDAVGFGRVLLLLLAAGFCQLRLLCNLFDGMVAVEAGRGSADGPFWNEFPDRVADMLILMGFALGIGQPALGWAAVAFAFLTAYVRQLGIGCRLPADFVGPMAKQHRMALVTGAALLALFEPFWDGRGQIQLVALWVIAIGAALTALRRAIRIVKALNAQGPAS